MFLVVPTSPIAAKVFPKLALGRRGGREGRRARLAWGSLGALMTKLMTNCQVDGNASRSPDLGAWLIQIRSSAVGAEGRALIIVQVEQVYRTRQATCRQIE